MRLCHRMVSLRASGQTLQGYGLAKDATAFVLMPVVILEPLRCSGRHALALMGIAADAPVRSDDALRRQFRLIRCRLKIGDGEA